MLVSLKKYYRHGWGKKQQKLHPKKTYKTNTATLFKETSVHFNKLGRTERKYDYKAKGLFQ
jgi:hypothetical protein